MRSEFDLTLAALTRLGPYEIVAPLGAGGMGEVYRARDTRLGREVAVKVLPEAFATHAERRARFEREARAVAALSHPNILSIHDYGTHEAITFAVMELLEGETLRDRLKKGPLPWKEATEIGAAIAEGLAAAHAKGIVHRDLKPENLFLVDDGRVKILDFGLARVAPVASTQTETSPYVPAETDPGTVMGTVGYMSPEQVRGQPADARSDIFSLGCVLYEMLTGRRAFQRDTAAETMTAILHDEPPEPASSGNQAPADLAWLMRHCLAKSTNARLQSARDLAIGLRAAASNPALAEVAAPRRLLRGLAIGIVAAVLLVAVIAASAYFLTQRGNQTVEGQSTKEDKAIEAVAVLPFVNEGGDPKTEFLSDGVADQIINSLSQVRRQELKVRPFTSVARYKGKEPDIPSFGRELNVQMIVTGRLQQTGDSLTIHVAVVAVKEEAQLWGKTYHGKRETILDLQDQIARDVAAKLGLQLSGEEEQRLTKRHTGNAEAYQLYLKGRHQWNKRTPDGFRLAIEYFQKALGFDHAYALAHAALADCYNLQASYYIVPANQAYPKAKASATRALEIDDTLAEAHAALACERLFYGWDWQEAGREFRRAVQLNPNYATGRHWHAEYLWASGQLEEAIAEIRRARELDPLSPVINAMLGWILFQARRDGEALEQLRETVRMDPDFPLAHWFLGVVQLHRGAADQFVSEWVEERRLTGEAPQRLAQLQEAYTTSGLNGFLLKLKDLDLAKTPVPSHRLGQIDAILGNKDSAFSWLDRAFQERAAQMVYLKWDRPMESLHSDPRFTELLGRMGLAGTGLPKDQPLDTLAVLPFENQSTDPEAGYLGDDITFSLTESLARFRDLKVRSFSSASRFKDKSKTPVAAGRELQVPAVLTGTIQKRGDEIVIFVELVDVHDDQSLIKQRYQGKFADRLKLQQNIVQDIPGKLRMALTVEQKRALAKMPTQNLQAHELYVRGRIEFGKRTPESLRKALDNFEAALKLDPNFALAYSGKADVYQILFIYADSPRNEAMLKAKAAAEKAIELEPTLAEAHISLAHVKGWDDWDFPAALELFRKGVDLKPNYATGRHWYGEFLSVMGRHEEAVEQFRLAIQIDPDSPVIRADLAAAYRFVHKYDEAIGELNAILAKNPAYTNAHAIMGVTLLQRAVRQKEHLPAAIKELREANRLSDGYGFSVDYLAAANAVSGDKAAARKTLAEYTAAPPTERAVIHLALGEKDQALKELERAYQEKDGLLVYANVDPYWDAIRSEPRFQAIMKKLNFPK